MFFKFLSIFKISFYYTYLNLLLGGGSLNGNISFYTLYKLLKSKKPYKTNLIVSFFSWKTTLNGPHKVDLKSEKGLTWKKYWKFYTIN
jgi:hypothetical protein